MMRVFAQILVSVVGVSCLLWDAYDSIVRHETLAFYVEYPARLTIPIGIALVVAGLALFYNSQSGLVRARLCAILCFMLSLGALYLSYLWARLSLPSSPVAEVLVVPWWFSVLKIFPFVFLWLSMCMGIRAWRYWPR